jgi:phospholipase C
MLAALDDAANGTWDPDHTSACETLEIDNGKMDHFAGPATCSDPRNVVAGSATVMKPYWDLAAKGALADRWFQPVVGQSFANDMYMVRAGFEFADNSASPKGAVGVACTLTANVQQELTGTTIGDLLTTAGVSWTYYAGGYDRQAAAVAMGTCATRPLDCPAKLNFYPCTFDPGDVPFEYFASTRDSTHVADSAKLLVDLDSGTLPAVSFVRAVGYESEHPGQFVTLSAGVTWVTSIVSAVSASRYRDATLVLLTYDEGGGYFDHVAPPPTSTVDNQPYGTRVPALALGPFAKKNTVSHVVMEHSSIVRFIEWNFLGGTTGQLGTRDATVNNIGSLLDPAVTGVTVPQ